MLNQRRSVFFWFVQPVIQGYIGRPNHKMKLFNLKTGKNSRRTKVNFFTGGFGKAGGVCPVCGGAAIDLALNGIVSSSVLAYDVGI